MVSEGPELEHQATALDVCIEVFVVVGSHGRNLTGGAPGRPSRLPACGSPFGLGLDRVERASHGGLPAPGDAFSPPAPERPEVGAELTAVLQLGSGLRLAQEELLGDVWHRASNEPEGDAVRA